MAYDGIVTAAIVKELSDELINGKIDRVYQPEVEELVLNIYTRNGNKKLYSTVDSAAAGVRLTDRSFSNPSQPSGFCMLMRKQLQGSRIVDIVQKDSDRIIELILEARNEMGYSVSRKLVFEIMGRHSNIILVDMEGGKIIESIKRVSIDASRVRPVFPGRTYTYPPSQNKIPVKTAGRTELNNSGSTWKEILSKVGGISPSMARELLLKSSGYLDQAVEDSEGNPLPDRYDYIRRLLKRIEDSEIAPRVYLDGNGVPVEFYITDLEEFEGTNVRYFDTTSAACEYFFEHRYSSNRVRQKSLAILKSVETRLEKLNLKQQRLLEDLNRAENSDNLRLYGELLTANMHLITPGAKSVTVNNYYDNSEVTIKLDPRYSPNRNAQGYFKRYAKAKTAVKEKKVQLEENRENITYLESVLSHIQNTDRMEGLDEIREELEDTGFLRVRKKKGKRKRYKPSPYTYQTKSGLEILAGRNNKENDYLTFKTAGRNDFWFHTKDIPGSHVILRTQGEEPKEAEIFETAAIAAWHSKGRASKNVPVDYVRVKHVKKPSGAKPGMVIFTDNRTVYVDPQLPERS